MCHSCASWKKFPDQQLQQSSEVLTEASRCSCAADALRGNQQLVLVLRECMTITETRLIHDERGDSLREAILTMILDLHFLDGSPAVIRLDSAPGFIALRNNDILHRFPINLDIGRVKNANKNSVAEKAIGQLEKKLLRQEPTEANVFDLSLIGATSRLNSCIGFTGLFARELWTQRSQFTNEQIPLSFTRS